MKSFYEWSPLTYWLSVRKCRLVRRYQDAVSGLSFAEMYMRGVLPEIWYTHKSLIRRTLGDVDPKLQENKAVNLALAAPEINKILIDPGEVFSFWHLVGNCTRKKGYQEGLVISDGQPKAGVGGGMCQMTNLIHWMVLHSPLTILEHHHHDSMDLFPDFGRQIPFGTGTSIAYNYLDYRFSNPLDFSVQLLVYTDGTYLCGQLRAEKPLAVRYHIQAENEYFYRQSNQVYRHNEIYRTTVDAASGRLLKRELLKENNAKVMYDTQGLVIREEG